MFDTETRQVFSEKASWWATFVNFYPRGPILKINLDACFHCIIVLFPTFTLSSTLLMKYTEHLHLLGLQIIKNLYYQSPYSFREAGVMAHIFTKQASG